MGNYIIRTTFFLILVAFFCNDCTYSQENPSQSDKFLVGSLLANTHDSQRWETQYTNYKQVLECGLNSVCQTAIKYHQDNNFTQYPNLDSLALFPFVYAANDSGTGSNTPRMNAKWWNVDWIAYFTQAKYRNWEAEIEDLFQDKHIGILRHNGEEYNINGIKGYSTNEYTQEGDTIITGPNYWQYPRYTFTNVSWNTTPIEYKLVFWMKIDTPCYDSTLAVCRIWVTNTDSTGDETILSYNGSPSIDTVYAYQLFSNEYTGISLEYDYKGLFSDLPENQDYPPLPGDPEIINSPGYNLGSKVQFKVQWLGNRKLFVDRIEVFDGIWNLYYKQHTDWLIDSIVTYDDKFKADNPLFYSRLKYYNTMDEPHSLDCYEPIRKLQDILDNNTNISADLLTHWYSG